MKVGCKFCLAVLIGCLVSGSLLAGGIAPMPKKEIVQKEVKLTEAQKLEFDFAFTEATKAVLLQELDKGLSLYATCLKIDPSSAVVRYELANIYMSQEDFGSALELSRAAVSLQPLNIWYQIQLANIYQKKGMMDQACAVYNELVKLHPERNDFYYLQAAIFASVEKFGEAIEVYNRLEKKVGIQEGISLEKERLYLAAGNRKMAYSEIQKLIKKNPYRADFYGMLADLYMEDKDEDKAFEQYEKILKIDPENGLVHFYLADFYRRKGEIEKSNASLTKAFSNSEIEADQKIQFLISILMNGNKEGMSDEYLKELLDILVEVHPGQVRVHALYADFLRKRKDNEGARYHLRKVLEEEKTNYVVWEELLLIDNEMLDFESMFNESSEALKYFPTQPILYIFKGVAAAQKQEYNAAIETLEEGFSYIGENVKLRVQFQTYLGDAYYQMGDAEKAFKAYDEVLLFEPQNVIVLNNYSYYLSVKGLELEKAKKMSSLCIKLEAENSTYLDTHGWVLYQMGEYQDAKNILEKAMEFGGGESAVIVEHYGDILFRLGDTEKALSEWKKAVEIGEGSEYLAEKIKTGSIPEEKKQNEQ
ncbi:tetratricopeptide repeat protein [Labilibaculum sp.]|uniref:tetratricopeptide repeat protein n=1 Tax=Labilibaculum sp. TaxID=2060723 RepID=UPI002AA946D7|nr:tetratricopeptide repeat protein [Labilibaculum sp.]